MHRMGGHGESAGNARASREQAKEDPGDEWTFVNENVGWMRIERQFGDFNNYNMKGSGS